MQHQTEAKTKPSFLVHSMYVKESSFLAPHTPHVFSKSWEPKLDVNFQTGVHALNGNDVFEVVLSLDAKIHLPSQDPDKSQLAFSASIKQAGVFTVSELDKDKKDEALTATAPSLLFPYVSEFLNNLTVRAGFPQLVLPPMNFNNMSRDKQQAA